MRRLTPLAAALTAQLCLPLWADAQTLSYETTQKIITLVLSSNPTLLSRQRIIEETRNIPAPNYGLSIPDMSISTSFGFLNPATGLFTLNPTVGVGLSISFGDPTRQLNVLKLREEKEAAKQDYEKARNEVFSLLFSKIRELQKLKSQKKNLLDLLAYLEDYSMVVEAQRIQQSIGLDKLWDLKQRIIDLKIEIETIASETDTVIQETAMCLGGDSWEEVLALLRQLYEQTA